MKTLISFALLMSFSMRVFAENREASVLITALREEGIDEKILESPLFERCKQDVENAGDQLEAEKENIRNCMFNALENVEADQIEELSDNLNIGAVNFEATKSADSIREYLEKRIFNAIHGENAHQKESLKELKFVDQAKFLELYESQITKNMILDISRYCLENIGKAGNPGNPGSLIVVESFPQEEGQPLSISSHAIYNPPTGSEKRYTPKQDLDYNTQKQTLSFSSERELWSQIEEYKYCPVIETDPAKSESPCYVNKARDQEMIKKLKEAELAVGNEHPDWLGNKYKFCSLKVVRNMCEIYRCKNIYTSAESQSLFDKSKKAGAFCNSAYGIRVPFTAPDPENNASENVSLDVQESHKKGQIACGLLSRIETYQKTFEIIEQVKSQNEELRDFSGLDFNLAYGGVYDGTTIGDGTEQKSIDQITSISSAELVNQTKGLNEMSEEAEELAQRCGLESGNFMADDPECAGLAGGEIDADYFTKIQLDTEAETAQYLKRLDKFNEADQQALEEFLIEHGLHEYVGEIGSIPQEQLVQLVKDKYKAERKALINNMKDRFYKLTKKDANSTTNAQDIADVAKDQIEEIKQNKERLETLLNYSNIVSSYLEVRDDAGNSYSNANPRNVEREGIAKYGEAENRETLQREYFNEGSEGAQAAEGALNAANFINQILGIAEDE